MKISQFNRSLHPLALPSGQPSTRVADRPSGPACGTQPPALTGCCIVLAQPSRRSSACASNRPFGLPSNSTTDLLGCCILRLSPPVNLRLAPPVSPSRLPSDSTPGSHRLLRLPARPSCQPSTRVSDRPFRPACGTQLQIPSSTGSPALPRITLRLASANNLRRCHHRNQSPTLIGYRILQLSSRVSVRLAPPASSSCLPSDSTSGSRRLPCLTAQPSGSTLLTCVSVLPFGPAFGTQPPTNYVVIS